MEIQEYYLRRELPSKNYIQYNFTLSQTSSCVPIISALGKCRLKNQEIQIILRYIKLLWTICSHPELQQISLSYKRTCFSLLPHKIKQTRLYIYTLTNNFQDFQWGSNEVSRFQHQIARLTLNLMKKKCVCCIKPRPSSMLSTCFVMIYP